MPKIEQIYAFIAEEEPGDEGITAQLTPSGWMPMIGADMDRAESLREMAQKLADAGGKPIRLVKFETRSEIEVINPAGPPDGGTVIFDPDGRLT